MTDHETARHIALVAHDNCKAELVRWVRTHARELKDHRLTCTGTTGRLVREALAEELGVEPHSETHQRVNAAAGQFSSGPGIKQALKNSF